MIGLYPIEVPIETPTDGLANDQADQEEVESKQALEGEDTSAEVGEQLHAPHIRTNSAESSTKTSAWLINRYTKDPMGSPEIRKFGQLVKALRT